MLHWLVSGRTIGGTLVAAPPNRLDRTEALRLYTVGSTWFSNDVGRKGTIAPGQLAATLPREKLGEVTYAEEVAQV